MLVVGTDPLAQRSRQLPVGSVFFHLFALQENTETPTLPLRNFRLLPYTFAVAHQCLFRGFESQLVQKVKYGKIIETTELS